MPSLFLIFNHIFTEEQKEDAREKLKINNFINMPDNLKIIWANIPPELDSISDFINPIKQWVLESSRPKDFVLIQGDFGACYLMVNFALKNDLVPIYATSKRQAKEDILPDGSIRLLHYFKHYGFRKYGL